MNQLFNFLTKFFKKNFFLTNNKLQLKHYVIFRILHIEPIVHIEFPIDSTTIHHRPILHLQPLLPSRPFTPKNTFSLSPCVSMSDESDKSFEDYPGGRRVEEEEGSKLARNASILTTTRCGNNDDTGEDRGENLSWPFPRVIAIG